MKILLKKSYDLLLRNHRIKKLIEILTPLMPANGSVLDIGCGNGNISRVLKEKFPDLKITGVDVIAGNSEAIKIVQYDGKKLPFEDKQFDCSMLITVLHHTDDYIPILEEAKRVTKDKIILFDHQYSSKLDWCTLALIDWPGNVPFGVYTPFNFKTRKEWKAILTEVGLEEIFYRDRFFFYGKFLDFLFGRNLHFASVLKVK
ncbi:MAG TPA: hypothetical protein DIV86_05155, partial [Alphaproteobacteria bacterium]|nr:hypothetical protein [Alphaproteobacteria bacterium]